MAQSYNSTRFFFILVRKFRPFFMEIVKIENFEKLKGISEDLRDYLIEKFSEINHKKWAPFYLLTGTVALQYWYIKRQWK